MAKSGDLALSMVSHVRIHWRSDLEFVPKAIEIKFHVFRPLVFYPEAVKLPWPSTRRP
jgi:hypothetical protein